MFEDLTRSTTERVLKQLRRLPWDEQCHVLSLFVSVSSADIEQKWILKALLKVGQGKFQHIHLIASVAKGLTRYHDVLGVRLVDEVLEAIRAGMENNNFRLQRQRLAMVKYLGELYNYRMTDSGVIFDTLYSLITLGHGMLVSWAALCNVYQMQVAHHPCVLIRLMMFSACNWYVHQLLHC